MKKYDGTLRKIQECQNFQKYEYSLTILVNAAARFSNSKFKITQAFFGPRPLQNPGSRLARESLCSPLALPCGYEIIFIYPLEHTIYRDEQAKLDNRYLHI
jgi:hypothetical protein